MICSPVGKSLKKGSTMKRRFILLVLFVLIAQLYMADFNRADLILNGGFEQPVGGALIVGPGSEPAGFGWSVIAGTIDFGPIPFSPFILYSPFEGDQVLDLNGNQRGTITQTFSTTPGNSYLLEFAYADNPDESGIKSADINVVDVASSFSLLASSVSHSTSTNSPIDADWTLFSRQFTATGALTQLTFTSTSFSNSASGGIILDAVSVTSVPEPGGLTMAMMGMVAMAFSRMRRLKPQFESFANSDSTTR